MKKIILKKEVIANISNADLNILKGGLINPTDKICSNGCPPRTNDCPTVPSCPLP